MWTKIALEFLIIFRRKVFVQAAGKKLVIRSSTHAELVLFFARSMQYLAILMGDASRGLSADLTISSRQ
jgi:hypothetical protein